jgi:predicted transcriptional regulator
LVVKKPNQIKLTAELEMNTSSANRLIGRDLVLMEALQGVGFLRVEAALLAYLSRVNSASGREIENATGMKAPDFRTALKKLKANGLIDVIEARSGRKGRSLKHYRLNTPLSGIAAHLEEVQLQEIEKLSGSLQRLKELSDPCDTCDLVVQIA